jgi:hypothetical protein
MREQRPYGKHELYIEEDLLIGKTHGDLSLSELQLFTKAADEVIGRHGHFGYLADNTEFGKFDPEARRFVAKWSVGKPIIGIAVFNADLVSRTLVSLVLKATNVIRRQSLPFDFFRTESDARAWLAQLRTQFLAKAKKLHAENGTAGRSSQSPP